MVEVVGVEQIVPLNSKDTVLSVKILLGPSFQVERAIDLFQLEQVSANSKFRTPRSFRRCDWLLLVGIMSWPIRQLCGCHNVHS